MTESYIDERTVGYSLGSHNMYVYEKEITRARQERELEFKSRSRNVRAAVNRGPEDEQKINRA